MIMQQKDHAAGSFIRKFSKQAPASKEISVEKASSKDIAIIGMSVRLPEASSLADFWSVVEGGKDCITSIPANRKQDVEAYLFQIKKFHERSYEEAAYLADIDKFDYQFFGIPLGEARLMDPNQRLFLETAWDVIDDAGFGGGKIRGSHTGVFLGISREGEYYQMVQDLQPSLAPAAYVGNLSPITASRLSYMLDLKGPSIAINTLCSSSLVAVHSACQSIRNGECEMALAGGIQLYTIPLRSARVGVESSDGRTRTFDDASDGTGTGEGVAAILLKPYSRALEDGDRIHAVIKGSAMNQDGASMSLTSPNPAAQEEVIVKAWRDADVTPDTITLIEAHGTGTKLGDPIEINAIDNAFRRYTSKKQFCAIGSVKSNMGHLDACAGIIGLIKSVLAIQHRIIPPSLHMRRPNRGVDFYNTPLYIADRKREWTTNGSPRTCGVSSFGLSGTNCHIVIQEYVQDKGAIEHNEDVDVFTLSGKSEEALLDNIRRMIHWIARNPRSSLKDICYMLLTGRQHHSHRLALKANTLEELQRKLCIVHTARLKLSAQESHLNEIFHGKIDNGKNPVNRVQWPLRSIYRNELIEFMRLYVTGANIDWRDELPVGSRTPLMLPGYSYQKERCWIQPQFVNQTVIQGMLHTTKWIREERKSQRRVELQHSILISHHAEILTMVADHLKNAGVSVVQILISGQERKHNSSHFEVASDLSSYQRVFNEIDMKNVSQIVILNCGSNNENINFYNYIQLFKFLLDIKLNQRVDLALISDNTTEVACNESVIHPIKAAFLGLGLVIPIENQNFICRTIDTDDFTDPSCVVSELIDMKTCFKVAFRQGARYIEIVDEVDAAYGGTASMKIRNTGTYVITGGLGRIGSEIARNLARSNRGVNITLLGRTALPPREQWNDSVHEDWKSKVRIIEELESLGAKVNYYSADVCDEERLVQIINEVIRIYGRINGIIHSAGVGVGMEGNEIVSEQLTVFEEVMQAKVQGTINLDRLTSHLEMDFMLLFSSAITLIGGRGSGHYVAANCYLDSYAFMRNKTGRKTQVIHWAQWEDSTIGHENMLFHPICSDQALTAFNLIVRNGFPKVIVGQFNEQSWLWTLDLPFTRIGQPKLPSSMKSEQGQTIAGATKKSSGVEDTRAFIQQAWKEVLGAERVGIDDNFFDIGGNSIMLAGVHAKVNERYPGIMNITDLFSYPTVRELADCLAKGERDFKSGHVNARSQDESKDNEFLIDLLHHLESGEKTVEEAVILFKSEVI